MALLHEMDTESEDELILSAEKRDLEKKLKRCQKDLQGLKSQNRQLQQALAAKVLDAGKFQCDTVKQITGFGWQLSCRKEGRVNRTYVASRKQKCCCGVSANFKGGK